MTRWSDVMRYLLVGLKAGTETYILCAGQVREPYDDGGGTGQAGSHSRKEGRVQRRQPLGAADCEPPQGLCGRR